MKKHVLVGVLITLAVILAGGVFAPAQGKTLNHYHYQDLGTLGGNSWGQAITDSGVVLGNYVGPGGFERPFLWSSKTGLQDLGVNVPDKDISSRGISKKSLIAGFVGDSAFYWTQNLGLQYIPTLGGNWNAAEGINSKGQVTGLSGTNDGYTHAFMWSKKGLVDLGVSGEDSYAYCINSRGQVAGFRIAGAHNLACLWNSPTDRVDLGTLPGTTSSMGKGINDLGQVVGESWGGALDHAFLWDPTGGLQDLGAIGGDFVNSWAGGVNRLGQVVGGSDTADWSIEHAFIWTPTAGMRDLNDRSLVPDLRPA